MRPSLIVGTAAFIWVIGSAACDRAPPMARADSIAVRPMAETPAAPPGKPSTATPAQVTPPSNAKSVATTPVGPEQIVEVIADKGAYPVALSGAATKFSSIANLAREAPIPDAVLMAGSGPGVRRLEIAFIKDAKGKWTFSRTTVLLVPSPPDDVPALHRRLEVALRKKLGKPKFAKRDEEVLPSMGWKLKGPIELGLAEETSTLPGGDLPERYIRIEVGAPNGEPD